MAKYSCVVSGLQPGARTNVVDVLADARGIMARHYRIEAIRSAGIGRKRGAVAVTIQVVVALMIRLPNLDQRSLD